MLSQGLKTMMISCLKRGDSLNKISRATGINKSTIYYHYEKMFGRKYKLPHFSPVASEQEGEIVGIFAGDGSQYFEPKRHSYEVNVHFGEHKRAYAEYVKALFESFFNKRFRLYQEKSGKLRLRTQSKSIFHYFSHYISFIPQIKHATVSLKTLEIPLGFKQGFLRGLVDTDGYVKRDTSGRLRICYYTTSKRLASQIQALLQEQDMQSSLRVVHDKRGYKPLFTIYVLSSSIDTFLKTVNPYKAQGPVAQR